jgi:CDP-diacylglycerol--glycerol-3-phosphate 3-phosphatidyltransferase
MKQAYTSAVRRAVLPLAEALARTRVTPNRLTIAGLVLNIATTPFIVTGHFIVASIVMLVGGIFDMLDGAVARVSGSVTPFGAFLDSTTDRLAEAFVLGALGVYFARQDQYILLAATFVVLVGSFLVSYTRARAEAIGVECTVGLASRPERIVLLVVGMLFARYHVLTVMIFALVGLTTFTVVQRVLHVRRQLLMRAGQAA